MLSIKEYENLKAFFAFYVENCVEAHLKSNDPEHQPAVFLGKLEKQSMATAKKGLQMAINDVVEMTSDWMPEKVAEVDKNLFAAGIISLSEVRQKYSKKYLSLLKRGQIKSITEYYFIKGIVDGGSIEPGASESEKMMSMLSDYEKRIASTH